MKIEADLKIIQPIPSIIIGFFSVNKLDEGFV